ncbi:MAG: hypothetical protein C0449_08805 [Polaromonas sp.]|nr:hypothetical protein [Polaromonas sp.]
MTHTLPVTDRDDLIARFSQGLSTRTLRHVAEEARLDSESLKQGVERYEIDYAWQVLGSQRLQEACLVALAERLASPVTDSQRACLVDVLQSAATAQPTDALMSFDNDVPAHLTTLLCAWFDRQSVRMTEAA